MLAPTSPESAYTLSNGKVVPSRVGYVRSLLGAKPCLAFSSTSWTRIRFISRLIAEEPRPRTKLRQQKSSWLQMILRRGGAGLGAAGNVLVADEHGNEV